MTNVPLIIYNNRQRTVIGSCDVTGEIPPTQKEEVMTIEYTDFVRKPFVVKVVEITEDNISEIAEEIGHLKNKEDGTPYISVRKGAVPNVSKVFPGWFMTRHGKRTHCYAPKVFHQQFVENTIAVQESVDYINSQSEETAVV